MLARGKKRGFTIVELVVVVVVIAVVLAIVMPIMKRQEEKKIEVATNDLLSVIGGTKPNELQPYIDAGAEVNCLVLFENVNQMHDIAPPVHFSLSPLSMSIFNGNFDDVKILVENGAYVNGVSIYEGVVPVYQNRGELVHPIFWAAHRRDEEIFNYLVEAGADFDAKLGGMTVVEVAEARGDSETAEWLRVKQAEMKANEAK